MNDNKFFKPTALYKEYMILDMIEKNSNITQREISKDIGIAVSMVNDYLNEYEKKEFISRKRYSPKRVEYFVTKKGIERRKVLNIQYLKSSHSIYLSAKDNISKFLQQIIVKGFKKVLLYGAGEVAEIMLQVINENDTLPLKVLAVIDDDPSKGNHTLANNLIIKKEDIGNYDHDGVLVSSYKHHEAIKASLRSINYPDSNIINFFD